MICVQFQRLYVPRRSIACNTNRASKARELERANGSRFCCGPFAAEFATNSKCKLIQMRVSQWPVAAHINCYQNIFEVNSIVCIWLHISSPHTAWHQIKNSIRCFDSGFSLTIVIDLKKRSSSDLVPVQPSFSAGDEMSLRGVVLSVCVFLATAGSSFGYYDDKYSLPSMAPRIRSGLIPLFGLHYSAGRTNGSAATRRSACERTTTTSSRTR